MGSPLDEPDRFPDEIPHDRVIAYRFAIATKEVTIEQYLESVKANPRVEHARNDRYSPDVKGPMNGVSWYHAVAYCNRLSEQENLPKDQWCYVPNDQGKYDKGMKIPANFFQRRGYRLPTEAEWEYAVRAGAMTSRPYGFSVELMEKYAWFRDNSHDRAWPGGSLKPNDLGLFDMLGNVYEWCPERAVVYQPEGPESLADDRIDDANRVLRGGAFTGRPVDLRSASRPASAPSNRGPYFGFRLAKTCD
jgi:formylglycine-generating enzyme required for sulfatase activity